jgi:hypothetical protein
MSTPDTKVCKKCQTEKPIADFWISDKERGYRRCNCKDCDRNTAREYYANNPTYKEKAKANSASWQKANPRSAFSTWKHSIKHKYGMLPDDYERMLKEQDGKCALCGTEDIGRTGKKGKWSAGRWNIDHCHRTGRVRGLLCHTCNVRVGAYEKLAELVGLGKVMEYLAR